jgi:hypothetical protein
VAGATGRFATRSQPRGKAGIRTVGGGEDRAAAHDPVVFTHSGVRFAFLAYDDIAASVYGTTETAPGTARLESGVLARDIAAYSPTSANTLLQRPNDSFNSELAGIEQQPELAGSKSRFNL